MLVYLKKSATRKIANIWAAPDVVIDVGDTKIMFALVRVGGRNM